MKTGMLSACLFRRMMDNWLPVTTQEVSRGAILGPRRGRETGYAELELGLGAGEPGAV
jgi:hypothetical protein